MAIENPCSCKLGGTCICSKLPRSAKSRGAKGGEMTAAGAGGEFGVPLAAAEPRRSAKKSRDPGQSSFDPDPAGLGHVPHEADRNWFIVDDGLASGSGYGMAGAPDWQMPQGDGLFAADAGSPFHQGILPTMGWTQAQGGLPHAVSVPQQQQLFYDPSMMMHGLPYNGVGTSPFPSIHGGDLGPWHHVATGSSAAFGSIPAAGVPPGSLHPGVFQPAQAISASVNVDRGIAGLVGSSAAHSAGVQAAEARTTSSCCSSKDVQSAPPTTAVGLGQLQLCACGCYTATGICDSCAGHCEHDKDPLEESHGEDGGCCGAVSSCCGGGTSCACGDGAVDGCAACAGGCACGTGGGSGCCS
ncbi:hypothetical protein DFJ74DRAFT_210166 [Hyaloraphidium curvatum]|nr:hypothetical protein DFJ74DRAFT_210166 [Hyaloraphidium curvatum]